MIVLSGGKKVFPEEVEAVLEKALTLQKSVYWVFLTRLAQKTEPRTSQP